METNDFLILDIETAGGNWNQFPSSFQLLFTGTKVNTLYSFYGSDPKSLSALADTLSSFEGVVITFNGTKFDLPLLDHCFKLILQRNLEIAHHYDIFAEIKKQSGSSISLDRLSRYTFGTSKMEWDHRKNAYIWANEPHLMVDYNKTDLDLTSAIFTRIKNKDTLFLDHSTVTLDLPSGSFSEFKQEIN